MISESLYKKISISGAFLLWFTWTYLVNQKSEIVLISAIAQGFSSSIITSFMITANENLYHRFDELSTKILMPPIIILLVCLTLGYVVHTIIGTTHILETLSPALAVGFVFSLITCLRINRNNYEENPDV